MAQLLAVIGFKRVATTSLMMRFIVWAMRADLR